MGLVRAYRQNQFAAAVRTFPFLHIRIRPFKEWAPTLRSVHDLLSYSHISTSTTMAQISGNNLLILLPSLLTRKTASWHKNTGVCGRIHDEIAASVEYSAMARNAHAWGSSFR